jgi:hypothetical protein
VFEDFFPRRAFGATEGFRYVLFLTQLSFAALLAQAHGPQQPDDPAWQHTEATAGPVMQSLPPSILCIRGFLHAPQKISTIFLHRARSGTRSDKRFPIVCPSKIIKQDIVQTVPPAAARLGPANRGILNTSRDQYPPAANKSLVTEESRLCQVRQGW